jgi:hypothetical protein
LVSRLEAYLNVRRKACPVLDTGMDEGNEADGRFSTAC